MSSLEQNMLLLSEEMVASMMKTAAELGPQPDTTLMPPAEGRALTALNNRSRNANLPEMGTVADIWVEADRALGSERCRMRVLVPEDADAGAILFVHGGGFAFGSPESHERSARVLALETGMPVLMPDYRLAPEHPYPAGLLDVIACLRGAFAASVSAGVAPGPLLVGGDSAGANLALAAMLHEQSAGRPPVSGALLFYGCFARNFTTPSYEDFADGPGLTRAKMQRFWDWYADHRHLDDDPLACPLAASDATLAALPPLYLLAAAVDPLLSDTLRLHERLRAIGRNEGVTVVPGVTHGFLQNTLDLKAAREALSAAAMAAKTMIAGA